MYKYPKIFLSNMFINRTNGLNLIFGNKTYLYKVNFWSRKIVFK